MTVPPVSAADCHECGGRGEVAVTPGLPGDGAMACPRCSPSAACTHEVTFLVGWREGTPLYECPHVELSDIRGRGDAG